MLERRKWGVYRSVLGEVDAGHLIGRHSSIKQIAAGRLWPFPVETMISGALGRVDSQLDGRLRTFYHTTLYERLAAA